MPSNKKIELKEQYSELLADHPDFIMTRYSGLDVEKMTDLRRQLSEKNVPYRVIKNNIFKIALQERDDIQGFPMDETFVGPLGVVFIKEDVPAVAKVLKQFAEKNEHMSMVSGVMESNYYDAKGVASIASMPSKEESLATLASALNSPARNIASLMNQVMSSLARAIQAVGEKNG